MKTILFISLISAIGLIYINFSNSGSQFDNEFEQFISTYGKNYASQDELEFRRAVFDKNMEEAAELNILNPRADFGVTQFADLTDEEMKLRMGLVDRGEDYSNAEVHTKTSSELEDLDFTHVMKKIQSQGSCGACYAFAAIAAFEGRSTLFGRIRSAKYSEQEAMDCPAKVEGCEGGWYFDVWAHTEKNKACLSRSYGYTGKAGECKADNCEKGDYNNGYMLVAKVEESIHDSLKTGPVAIAVDASTWKTYRSGIVDAKGCGTGMTHAVVIVGYNKAGNYWNVRNSWGSRFGERGHIRLSYGENTCNLLYNPGYPRFEEILY